MSFNGRFLTLLIILSLTACTSVPKPSFIRNRANEYLTAESIAPLRLPPGTPSGKFQSKYPVSYHPDGPPTQPISLEPPGLYN